MSLTAQIDELLARLDAAQDVRARRDAQALASALIALHRAALVKLVEGHPSLDALARDPEVAPVLLLHELHPLALDARVQEALERLAPVLAAEGASAILRSCSPDGIRVRLAPHEGAPRPGAAARLTGRVEGALYDAAPEAATVIVDAQALDDTPLIQIGARQRPRGAEHER